MGNRPISSGAGGPGGPREDLLVFLAEAYDACAEGLFRYAAMLLADPSAAEDAVQQVFVKLAGRRQVRDIRAMTAYLRRAVRNECYSLLERRARQQQVPGERPLLEAIPAPNDDAPASTDATRQALEGGLRLLSPQQREVVHMKVYEKMTFRQIAQATGVPINTAASRYRYALARLRELLGPLLEDER